MHSMLKLSQKGREMCEATKTELIEYLGMGNPCDRRIFDLVSLAWKDVEGMHVKSQFPLN